jgi:hypothetical protein
VFYPLHAIISYSSLLLKNTRNPQQDHLLFKEKIPPTIDEQPTIIKKDGKEKE